MFITGFAAVALNPDSRAPKDAKVLSKPFHLRDLVNEVNGDGGLSRSFPFHCNPDHDACQCSKLRECGSMPSRVAWAALLRRKGADMKNRVAVIGLGSMGWGAAVSLLRKGFDVQGGRCASRRARFICG